MRSTSSRQSGLAPAALLFGLPLLTAGIWVTWTLGVGPMLGWVASQTWTATSCRIVEVEQVWNDSRSVVTITPRYEYSVAGSAFVGSRYDFGNHRLGAEAAAAVVAAFPPDARVTCYVDPDAPAESVLTQEYSTQYTSGCAIGSVFMLLGATLSWIGFTRTSRSATLAEINMSGD